MFILVKNFTYCLQLMVVLYGTRSQWWWWWWSRWWWWCWKSGVQCVWGGSSAYNVARCSEWKVNHQYITNALQSHFHQLRTPCNFFSVIICHIAIAYSMGQIIKSFCVCPCVRVCVCPSVDTLTVAFLRQFSPNWTQTCKPPKVRTSSLGVNIAPPLPLFSY